MKRCVVNNCTFAFLWVSIRFILDAVYVYVVPWSEFPIVPSYPHYPHFQVPDNMKRCVVNNCTFAGFWSAVLPPPTRGEEWAGGERERERASQRARERADQAHTVVAGEGGGCSLPEAGAGV